MPKHAKNNIEERKRAGSKTEFIQLSGIGPELAGFVADLIEKPENFYAIPLEKRNLMEKQMNTFLSSFE